VTTAAGRSRTFIEARHTLNWKAWALPAVGIRCARCGSSNGGKATPATPRVDENGGIFLANVVAEVLACRFAENKSRRGGDRFGDGLTRARSASSRHRRGRFPGLERVISPARSPARSARLRDSVHHQLWLQLRIPRSLSVGTGNTKAGYLRGRRL